MNASQAYREAFNRWCQPRIWVVADTKYVGYTTDQGESCVTMGTGKTWEEAFENADSKTKGKIMKLKIERVPEGVRLEFAQDRVTKPVSVELDWVQVEMVAALLLAAAKADKFVFEVEM